jgi:hypothetical protein
MRKSGVVVLMGMCAIAGLPGLTSARGLLGERYGSLYLGMTRPGDSTIRSIDSAVVGFGADLNLPLKEDIDLNFSISHQELDGDTALGQSVNVDTTAFIGGANLLLQPGEKVCPFAIGRVGIVDVDGDTEGMIALGGAVQVDLTKDAAVTPSLVFHHIDDTDDLVLGADGNLWLSDSVFAIAGIAVGFDEGDLIFTLGAGLAF